MQSKLASFLDPLYRWITNYMGSQGFILYGKDSPPVPAAPDYTALAEKTQQGNLDMARMQFAANRVNQNTPYGSLSYSQTGTDSYGNPTYTATQNLSPEQQDIYNKQTNLSRGILGAAQGGVGNVANSLAQGGVDTSKLASTGINPGETYSDAIMRRLQPQMQQEKGQFDAQMANQGIAPGTEAYNNAKRSFDQAQNDKLTSAVVGGFNTGLAANQQGYNQARQNLAMPIDLMNAVRTGSQVTNPNYVNNANMANVSGADYLGAGQNQYNANMANYNANMANQGGFFSGLLDIGKTAAMAPSGTFSGPTGLFQTVQGWSDERLKDNVKRIGTHDLGVGIYSFNYKKGYDLPEGTHIGVMAQELEKVKPEAVSTADNGYKLVNYALI
jgi:hypothetical protein